jgi:hypothetical protein
MKYSLEKQKRAFGCLFELPLAIVEIASANDRDTTSAVHHGAVFEFAVCILVSVEDFLRAGKVLIFMMHREILLVRVRGVMRQAALGGLAIPPSLAPKITEQSSNAKGAGRRSSSRSVASCIHPPPGSLPISP